jgi:hypothetical protein
MLLKTERPQSTDLTIELKLSSRIMMSAASLATSVPRNVCSEMSEYCFQGQTGRADEGWPPEFRHKKLKNKSMRGQQSK